MLMKQIDVLRWAVKGLRAEIDRLEKDVNVGKRLLLEYEKGGQPKTKKSPQEIKVIIAAKQAEIERLDRERFYMEWNILDL